ncbi:MAG: hypothetical protein ACI87M_000455, partial [Yoonia sp.]
RFTKKNILSLQILKKNVLKPFLQGDYLFVPSP